MLAEARDDQQAGNGSPLGPWPKNRVRGAVTENNNGCIPASLAFVFLPGTRQLHRPPYL
jgi:hypothetical protein